MDELQWLITREIPHLRRYALALQGDRGALTLFLRTSRDDVYADGEASVDDRPLKDAKGRPAFNPLIAHVADAAAARALAAAIIEEDDHHQFCATVQNDRFTEMVARTSSTASSRSDPPPACACGRS